LPKIDHKAKNAHTSIFKVDAIKTAQKIENGTVLSTGTGICSLQTLSDRL